MGLEEHCKFRSWIWGKAQPTTILMHDEDEEIMPLVFIELHILNVW